jgi:hypothetical protein
MPRPMQVLRESLIFLKRVQIIATWLAHTENSLGMVMINDAARH